MSDKLSLDKTSISIGLIVVLAPTIFLAISTWTRMQSQTERNTTDIAAIFKKLDTLNDNLVETNGNIIKLNTRLDGLTSERGSISVAPVTQPEDSVVVVRNNDMQPIGPQQNNIQPAEPPQESKEPVEPQEPSLASLLQQALGNVFEVARR